MLPSDARFLTSAFNAIHDWPESAQMQVRIVAEAMLAKRFDNLDAPPWSSLTERMRLEIIVRARAVIAHAHMIADRPPLVTVGAGSALPPTGGGPGTFAQRGVEAPHDLQSNLSNQFSHEA